MAYVQITASPRGHRCGLFHYAGGERAITVLVLPKVWGAQQQPRVSVDGDHLTVVLHELDKVVLDVGKAFADWLSSEVQASINDSVSRALAKRRAAREAKLKAAQARKPVENVEEVGEEEDDADDCDAVLNELVAFSATRGKRAPIAQPGPGCTSAKAIEAGRPDVQGALLSLIHLASCCRRSTNIWAHDADAQDGSGGAVGERGERSKSHDPLALLAQWLFVEQMEARIRKIRRGYIPIVETSCVVRGRPTMRGMIEQAAMGTPWIECARDEFTEATPLYRVLVTALEHVATGAIADQFGLAGWSVAEDLAKKAVHVRRLLSAIPSLPLPVAANDAGRIRLTRLQREWDRPLELARQILRVEPPKAGVAGDGTEAIQWWFDTSKLWEDVIAQALEPHWTVDEQGSKDEDNRLTVWTDVGKNKRPDFVVSEPKSDPHPTRTMVIDAKYKGVSGTTIKVRAGDQYQAFAYSLLRGDSSTAPAVAPPDTVVLAFPVGGDTTAGVQPGAPRGPVHGNVQQCHLLCVGVPFPIDKDIKPPGAWAEYLRKVGEVLSSPKLRPPT